ncbi:MAG: aldehyde dehydrogenase family protein [Myxococcaceae bacterium]|nr:MAG: aldehyde dehydrogenase family protein [Myxococcaceae bacterium]
MSTLAPFPRLAEEIQAFNARGQLGKDPIAQYFAERRKAHGLFTNLLTDKELELLKPYLFCYRELPQRSSDTPVRVTNFIDGEWRLPAKGELALLRNLADRRIPLMEVPASTDEDVDRAVAAADRTWKSLSWAEDVFTYRKTVLKNFARMMDYFSEDCMREIRQQIPKTRLEAQKDFYEAKRAADHIEGSAEAALQGEILPPMLPGHSYWRNPWVPAGVSVIISPMNFIWGIPGIHLVGAYLAGVPFIYKGHPFAAISNTTMIRMMLAAGADPAYVQKVEGFGKGIAKLATDKRVTVVAVTGSSETAAKIQEGRGLNRLRFEGGGCNWSYVDDGYTPEELKKIAVRLTYSVCGFGAHKCTSLHGIAASGKTLDALLGFINEEMNSWRVADPREATDDKVVSPLMVHKAQTLVDIVAQAKKTPGVTVIREGGRADGAYGEHSEAVKPALLKIRPDSTVRVNWDGKGVQEVRLATTEFFMPILVGMELPDFESYVRFCLFENSHDLATSVWTRDDRKLQLGRRTLGGMLKENDGTDSALEWEEFGASGIGDSGNMGVGEVTATLSIYTRRQKGRHLVF